MKENVAVKAHRKLVMGRRVRQISKKYSSHSAVRVGNSLRRWCGNWGNGCLCKRYSR
jgi:hypothetical protein